MKSIKPNKAFLPNIGILLTIIAFSLSLLLSININNLIVISNFFSIFFFILGLYFTYIHYSFFNTTYQIQHNKILIIFGIHQYVIPLNNIRSIILIPNIQDIKKQNGISWFGSFYGNAHYLNEQILLFFSNNKKNELVLIKAAKNNYLISCPSYEEFRKLIATQRILGGSQKNRESKKKRVHFLYKIYDNEFFYLIVLNYFLMSNAVLLNNETINDAPESLLLKFPFKHFQDIPEYITINTLNQINQYILIVFFLNLMLSLAFKYYLQKGHKSIQLISILINSIAIFAMVYAV